MKKINQGRVTRRGKRKRSRSAPPRANKRLLQRIRELEQRNDQHITLRKLSSYLKASLTPAEAFLAIERFGPQLFPGAIGKLYLVHPPGNHLELAVLWGAPSRNERSFMLQECWALRRAQPHWIRDPRTELLCEHVTPVSKSVLPYLCIPLIAQGKMLGLLHLQRLKAPSNPVGNPDSVESGVDLAITVAEELGLALSNLRLRETLQEQSIRDPLTGLYNRRFLEEFLVRELARAGRKRHPLSIVMLDLDHFKRINDTLGHGAGDMVLRRLGMLLQAHVRESDIACRIGGEEFSLLLPEVPLPIAVQRAEDIRKALQEMKLEHEDRSLGTVTASLGVAVFPEHGANSETLIRSVDQALYIAKHKGRNKVVAA